MNRSPKIYRRGKWWYLRYYEGDRLRRESLGTSDKDVAERKRVAKEREFLPPDERPTLDPSAHVTIKALVDTFLAHAKGYYRKADGRPTGEASNFHDATVKLASDFGHLYVSDFGPKRLKELRDTLISTPNDRGEFLSRNTINGRMRRIRQVFKWGVENELVKPETLVALQSVQSLRKHRSDAKETAPIAPVAMADINAIEPHVSRQVWAMIQLQLLTAARPGEIVRIRPRDIDTRDSVWVVSLGDDHKTAHQGKSRELYLGPKAQAILRPFLFRGAFPRHADAYLFSPIEADRERRAKESIKGKDRPRRENQPPTPRETDRRIGEAFTVMAYYGAIQRGCAAADVAPWSPNRLRHTAATEIRREHGIEAAKVILGHGDVTTTEIYAEKNQLLALNFARENG